MRSNSPGRRAAMARRLAIPGSLCLLIALMTSALSAGAQPAVSRATDPCGSYQCFRDATAFLESVPSPKPGQQATVPLAARVIGAAPRAPQMLVGFDNGNRSFWGVSDGFAQGRSGLIGGVPAGNVLNFSHWQYVDELYYYLHETVSIPPTQWVNVAHRNGVPVLGTVTGDCDGCDAEATELFAPENYQKTVQKLYDYAAVYGFDGWVIDMELGFKPSPGVLRAVQDLSEMVLPDGHHMQVAVYQAHEISIGDMLPYFQAGAQWQADYAKYYSVAPPADTYQTLLANNLQRQNLRAFWASYVYQFESECRHGDQTTASQIWNGNSTPDTTPSCLDTAQLFENQRAVVPSSRDPGTPPYYTSLSLFAPGWTFFGNLPDTDREGPASQALVQAADDALWVGFGVRYSGPSCRRSGTGNAVSALISPGSVVGKLPFVTNFNQGEGNVYAVQGQPVAAVPWNNLSAQDVLPTWYCAVRGRLTATPVYAATGSGGSFNGGSALRLSGGAGQVELYETRIPVRASARPRLAFVSKTLRGTPPYVRISYSNGASQTVQARGGSGWRQTLTALRARGHTITAISVGERGRHAVDSLLGQIRLYDASHNTTPAPITVRSAAAVITWPTARKPAVAYWNVYLSTRRCLRFLGPAFTNRYAVTQAMFAPGQRADRYVIQPVSVTGSVAKTRPACPAPRSGTT